MKLLALGSLFILSVAAFDVLRDHCKQPLHFGVQKCDKKPSLRWHMDPETLQCLTFTYTGCGGNGNNFETESLCYHGCLPMDYSTCPANSQPVKNKDGSTGCGRAYNQKECDGPHAYCANGGMIDRCCDVRVRDKLSKNLAGSCGTKKIVQLDNGSYKSTLLGKTCDSKMCPKGSTCHQGDYFAFCCQ